MIDTVDPNDLEISRGEKYRNEELVRRHNDSGRSITILSATRTVLDLWADGDLSEGQATKALRTDRLTARTLKEIYQTQSQ